jgi:hypothetical protein
MRGQLVCYRHGGASPQGRAAGQRRLAEAAAARVVADLADAPPMETISEVYDELLAVAGTARAWREILQTRVAGLKKLGTESTELIGTQLQTDVILFERALDRSAKIGEALVRLDLEGRKQALDERTAGQLVAVLRLILGDLNLTDEQAMVAELVVPKRLKELA